MDTPANQPPVGIWTLCVARQVFTRWCNLKLQQRGLKIDDWTTDVGDGITLIDLWEVASGKTVSGVNRKPGNKRYSRDARRSLFLPSTSALRVDVAHGHAPQVLEDGQHDPPSRRHQARWRARRRHHERTYARPF
jgi:hypothetical protein